MWLPLPPENLGADLTTLALCWRLLRRDGVALGFTSHDRALVLDGLTYASAPGMLPSAVVQTDGVEVDSLDIGGALTADAITAADLAAGRWDGAAVALLLLDWQAPSAGALVLARGTLGAVAVGQGNDAGFSASVQGPTAALAAMATATCSPECRAELGDARCRVSMRGRVQQVTVSAVDGARLRCDVVAADHVEGRLRVLAGAHAGLDRRIIAVDGDWLVLDAALDVAPGSLIRLWQGCDKQFATCRDRFGNAANFRGEPHVPGGDMLARYGTN
jgi:uncharacterized phage protein (TIGR02218 family)